MSDVWRLVLAEIEQKFRVSSTLHGSLVQS